MLLLLLASSAAVVDRHLLLSRFGSCSQAGAGRCVELSHLCSLIAPLLARPTFFLLVSRFFFPCFGSGPLCRGLDFGLTTEQLEVPLVLPRFIVHPLIQSPISNTSSSGDSLSHTQQRRLSVLTLLQSRPRTLDKRGVCGRSMIE